MKTVKTAALATTLSLMSVPALMVAGVPAYAATITLDPSTITAGTSGSNLVGGTTFSWDLGTCTSCDPDTAVYEITPNSNLGQAGVEAITGDNPLTLAYKNDNPAESGGFGGNYSTSFTPVDDPGSALITWDGGGFIADAMWLEVKDGNADPSMYLFDISGWDGQMDIALNNFWPAQGAISHVSIWTGDTTNLAEPSSLAILAFGLLGVGAARRRRQN